MKSLNSAVFIILVVVSPLLTGWPTAQGLEDFQPYSDQDLRLQRLAETRTYSGGVDESDLEIAEGVTTAKQKITRRQIEREVYKSLFQKDLQGGSDEDESADGAEASE